jgi:hypothetical protein
MFCLVLENQINSYLCPQRREKQQYMTERFYEISHLTTDRLRELFASYRKHGWIDFEHYQLTPAVKPITLPDAEVILNIQAGNEGNYFVYMLDYEDEEDGVMIGLGLTYYEGFSAFLHLPPRFLPELVEKYNLDNSHEARNYTINEFLIEEQGKNPLN